MGKPPRPFIGPAGSVLWAGAHKAGFNRDDCSIHNLIDEWPGKGDDISPWYTEGQNMGEFTEEGLQQVERLRRELEGTSANVIIPLGNAALQALTGKFGITKWRGSLLESTLLPGRKVIPTIHPSAALKGNPLFRWRILYDLEFAWKDSRFPELKLPQRRFLVPQDVEEALYYFNSVNMKCADKVAIDIEVVHQQVASFQFSTNPFMNTVNIPFIDQYGKNRWTLEEERQIWWAIEGMCGNQGLAKIYQNHLFDTNYLLLRHGIHTEEPIEDTMIMAALCDRDLPIGLDFLTSVYTREPYYKDERKISARIGDYDMFLNYGMKDAAVTLEIYPHLYRKVVYNGVLDNYRYHLELCKVLRYMQARGVRSDRKRLHDLRKGLETEAIELLDKLHEITGPEFNPNSPQQIARYFYKEKKLTPYRNRKTKRVTTDVDAMKRIARKGYKEAHLILALRKKNKILGLYPDKIVDPDGRLRCSWNAVGAPGRLSSSQTVFGTGANLQNIPDYARGFLTADQGQVLVDIDLSQAEWITMAFLSQDLNMMEAAKASLEGKLDIHRYTASHLFNTPYDQVTKEQRQDGKQCNHAFNYGRGYKAYALEHTVPERIAKQQHAGYHRIYQGVERYWNWVEDRLTRHNRMLVNCFGYKRRFLGPVVGRDAHKTFLSAYNFIPQSTVGQNINKALIPAFEDQRLHALGWDLLLQCHDSVVQQCPEDPSAISEITTIMRDHLKIPLTYNNRTFVLSTDVKIGYNWGHMIELPSGEATTSVVSTALDELRRKALEDPEWRRES